MRYPVQLKIGQRLTYPAIAYAIPGMRVGEIRSVKASPNLTYYERKLNPKVPPNATLRYEIELLSVSDEWNNEAGPEFGGYNTSSVGQQPEELDS